MLTYITTHFSYNILFIWSLLEGEIGLSIAGYLSKEGHLNFFAVVAIAFSGAILSDTALYFIGKHNKRLAYRILKRYRGVYKNMIRWMHRYGKWIIVFDRFMYGTHIPAMLSVGISHYPFKKFFIYEVIGVAMWSIIFTSLGYFFGEKVVSLVQMAQKNLLLFFILAILLYLFYKKRPK